MRTRFFSFVAAVALFPLLMALVVTQQAAARYDGLLASRLSLAGVAVKARFEADVARRRELLLRLSLHEVVARAVSDAVESASAPSDASPIEVREAAARLDPAQPPDAVALVTAQGVRMVGAAGELRASSVADVPLALEALEGRRAEGLVRFEGGLHLVAAAPVGMAEGALVLMDHVGDDVAIELRNLVKASAVTFANAGSPLASSLPEPIRTQHAASQAGKLVRIGQRRSGLTGPAWFDRYLPLGIDATDSAAMGFDLGGGMTAVVAVSTAADLADLSRLQLWAFALGLATLLLAVVWSLVLEGPTRRQLRVLKNHVARIRAERGAQLGVRGFTPAFEALVVELDGLSAELSQSASEPSLALVGPLASSTPASALLSRLAPDVVVPRFDDVKPFEDPFARVAPMPEPSASETSREIPLTADVRPDLQSAPVETDRDEEHFRKVYDVYLALRRECGETSDPPSFVRFAASLRKNRDQLASKFSGRPVRFHAYVKEGKAAIKAAPVR